MPRKERENVNNITLAKLLKLTLTQGETKNRLTYMNRDVLVRIRVIEVKDLKHGGFTYRIESSSFPQYQPYTKGKRGQKQRLTKHTYPCTISLDRLSLDTPNIRLRLGREGLWRDVRPKKVKRGRNYVVEGDINAEYGINGDFYWRCEPLYAAEGILFGRWYNKEIPKDGKLFLPKHLLRVVLTLAEKGVLTRG